MKKIFTTIGLCSCLILLNGCALFGGGSAIKKEEVNRAKIVTVENKIADNATAKVDNIASLAFGTDYALSKVTNPPIAVSVARDMNQRVVSIAGSPTIDKMKEMQEVIDKLTSTLATEREKGKLLITVKDANIAALQHEARLLSDARDDEIRQYMAEAKQAAAVSDGYKKTVDQMDNWGGIGAIWYGIKKLVIKMAWFLGIGSILFLILRIASISNPIAGAVFGIFEQVVAWGINAIKVVFPKALSFAGHVSADVYDAGQSILKKIVDNIQNLKAMEEKLGHDLTLKELLVELNNSMNPVEKEEIAKIKKELGY